MDAEVETLYSLFQSVWAGSCWFMAAAITRPYQAYGLRLALCCS